MEIISAIREGNEVAYTADTGDVIIFTNNVVTWCSFPNGSDGFFEIFNAVGQFDTENP